MKTRGKILVGVAVLLGVAAAAPWWVPTSAWKGPLEEAASKALDAPVTLGAIDVVLLPLPHATLRDVDVGKGAIKVSATGVYPELASLFSSPRRLRSVELKQLDVNQDGIALLQRLAEKPSSGPAPVEVARVQVGELRVQLAAGPLPPLKISVELGPLNQPSKVLATTLDGKATVTVAPQGTGWNLEVAAAEWTLPFGPPLLLNQLKASGRIEGEQLAMPLIVATLYGGQVSGNAEVGWGKGLRISGKAKVGALDIAPVLAALKLKASLGGRLDADGSFRAQAAKPAALAEALQADVAFKVENGVLNGFDLASAAKSLLKGGTPGGQTRFDQLTGNVNLAGRAVRLRNLKVASGVLDARGNVDISPARQLGGRVEVDLKGTGGLVSVPLAVSGTVADPMLMPTKGALAGAALGTALLPGVGTSVGSSIGDKIGRMFGK